MEKQFFYVNKKQGGSSYQSIAVNSGNFESVAKGQHSPDNLWDKAHEIKKNNPDLGYVEPDLEKQNPQAESVKNISRPETTFESKIAIAEDEYDPNWPFPEKEGKPDKMIWHVNDDHAGLRSAWLSLDKSSNTVRIAHFDTGYDPEHSTFPKANIEFGLQKNFVEDNGSAEDIGSEGWLNQPGHGVGTLSILAGALVDLPEYHYHDFLGIHHQIKILPVRMSRSVILWKNKAFVEALEYVISLYDNPETRCHVVTMSMGGMPSKAWADVINRAYDKGIFIVAASGDNFGRLTPSTLVYPARFNRVVAACGVCYDFSPYVKNVTLGNVKIMEGNFGPGKAMDFSIAAFTPNVSWAVINTGNIVSINGAGTSSATPQIAAAAALYYQKYFDELEKMEGWQKIETIRAAMFTSASKTIKKGYSDKDRELYFGNGILQARKMLDVRPNSVTIKKQDISVLRWPFLKLITGTAVFEAVQDNEDEMAMFEMEILQLIAKSAALQKLLDHEETPFNELTDKDQKQFYGILLEMPDASNSLKKLIMDNHLF
ncbi:S8/S53 family peptidase [Pedobacter sp. L105]|uniref:S8 family peptidase n=1 Tax=Pedobacter sp. L105 TaxID=1641871 RepID=UPI00131B510C|nr:S8/S53 family peptidase [Pedobacter sp. L105]